MTETTAETFLVMGHEGNFPDTKIWFKIPEHFSITNLAALLWVACKIFKTKSADKGSVFFGSKKDVFMDLLNRQFESLGIE